MKQINWKLCLFVVMLCLLFSKAMFTGALQKRSQSRELVERDALGIAPVWQRKYETQSTNLNKDP